MTYTPLKTNVLSSFVQNTGLTINPNAVSYMGVSASLSSYTFGSVVSTTVLNKITSSIQKGWGKLQTSSISNSTYNALISIGSTTIPALGNSAPPAYTNTYTGQRTSWGWLRLFPLTAYQEFHPNGSNQYSDFISTFTTCHGKMTQLNIPIKALNNSITYLDGVYSNMNDLVTADITGVSTSTLYWGQDLIKLGRAFDLLYIETFGNPDNLLKTLFKNRALTGSVNIALLSAGLSSTDISNIVNGTPATTEQQKLIYAAFCLIQNQDLRDVLIPLNCQTQGLQSLADLLDPKMMFPNSNTTLTYPQYNATFVPTNSKTYFLLYSSRNSVDIKSGLGIGERLKNILPLDIAYACDALSIAMLQIRNIQNMDIQKFSQVVANLETMKGLNGINGTSVPTNVGLTNSAIPIVAKGTGPNGSYTMCDFFGCMTDLKYPWQTLQAQINKLNTTALASIYNSLDTLLSTVPEPINLESQVLFYIAQANSEIANILANDPTNSGNLNTTYNNLFGLGLKKEEDARALALPTLAYLTSDVSDTITLVDCIPPYSKETELCMTAQVLENIADFSTIGGNSLVGSMREARNGFRLALTGAEQDNDVNGTSTEQLVLPRPNNKTTATNPIGGVSSNPTINQPWVTNSDPALLGQYGLTYPQTSNLSNIPIPTGGATTPGSFGGSSETTLMPNNLNLLIFPASTSILTPDEAIQDVITCNCDCWDEFL